MMSSHIIKSTLIIQGIVFFFENNLKRRSLFNFNYADIEDGY